MADTVMLISVSGEQLGTRLETKLIADKRSQEKRPRGCLVDQLRRGILPDLTTVGRLERWALVDFA